MALFEIERVTPLPPAEAWRRLTTWERHSATVPLTRITVRTPPPSGTGTLFVARTGVGPIGFDDPMEVVEWEPDRYCRLRKTGRVVTGWAEIEVRPLGGTAPVTGTPWSIAPAGPGSSGPSAPAASSDAGGQAGAPGEQAPGEGDAPTGTVVRWREELRVRGVPRALDPVTVAAGRFIFGRALDTLLRV
ncbi:SRPBCC family protein [Actinacidiphila acidipaludis]|uniref:SRPBCC family protein n=1 Tax=Actinacidiphila acidipaludis TaxID=2873382 RepID=A0ABS7QIK5_9ACTN|nr:SRPBCC family protein [Streptomyces acidipaludis]